MTTLQRIRNHGVILLVVVGIAMLAFILYSHYENGKRDIPTDVLIKLADYYNVSVDYLLGRTDNPDKN